MKRMRPGDWKMGLGKKLKKREKCIKDMLAVKTEMIVPV